MKRGLRIFGILAGLIFILSVLFFAFSSEEFYGRITGDVVSSTECSDGTNLGQIEIGTGSARWLCVNYNNQLQNLDCYGGDNNPYLGSYLNGWTCGRWGWECGGTAFNSGYCCDGVNQQQSCPINGECVSYAGQTLSIQPANLCLQGTASSVTTETNTYIWTCQGDNGGSSASCSATKQSTPVNEKVIPDEISSDLQLLKEAVEEKDIEKCQQIDDDNSNIKTSCFDIFSSTYEEDYCSETDVPELCKDKIGLFSAVCGNRIIETGEGCDDGGTNWEGASCAADCSKINYYFKPQVDVYNNIQQTSTTKRFVTDSNNAKKQYCIEQGWDTFAGCTQGLLPAEYLSNNREYYCPISWDDANKYWITVCSMNRAYYCSQLWCKNE